MAIHVIAYDLHPSEGQTYDGLTEAIEDLGNTWHCLDSVWLIKSEYTSAEIRGRLRPFLKEDDQLLVIRQGDGAAWIGFTGDCQQWLRDNL